MSENPSETESDTIDDSKIWKKNSKFFYSLMISHRLPWPSLTIDWLKFRGEEKSLGYCTHRVLYGTHTSYQEQEQVIIDAIKIPDDNISDKQIESISKKNKIITNVATLTHQGEANRIRANPSNDFVLASKSSNGNVYVYQYKNISKTSELCKSSDKALVKILTGHKTEGYGLEWNTINLLASGSYDNLVCYWDCNSDNCLPISQYFFHENPVEDLAWFDNNTIASVGDDKKVVFVDIRDNQKSFEFFAHQDHVNSVEFNKKYKELMVTASSDHLVSVWDIRNYHSPLINLQCAFGVTSAKWAPFAANLLATTGLDNKISIWNLKNCDQPCFRHEGHFAMINEFSWNPSEDLTIASVDEDNFLQVWTMHPGFLQ